MQSDIKINNDGKCFYGNRNIGRIRNRVFETYRDIEKHVHHNTKSIAINKALIDDFSYLFDYIRLIIGSAVYIIPVSYFIIKSFELQFSNYEPQYFIRLFDLTSDKVREWKTSKNKKQESYQNSLFGEAI